MFKDKLGSKTPPMYKVSHLIPRQARNEIDLEISETAGEILLAVVSTTTVAVMISMPISLNFFAKLALKLFLDAFKNLQIIVHIVLIDLFTVAHCEVFFGFILKISNLEFFDPSKLMIDTLPV